MEDKKFIESIEIDDYEILSDTGYVNIEYLHKTIKYQKYILNLKQKDKIIKLECADTHIVFDEFLNEVFVKDLKKGNAVVTSIDSFEKSLKRFSTTTGYEIMFVDSVEKTDIFEHMYDFELSEDSNHRYYTNGILSHNTTLAKILVNEFKHPHLYINASKDSSVEVLREQVSDFCSKHSMQTLKNERMKIVIFDEIDGASLQFFKALRGFMQDFKHVGFVATCNYVNKIPEAIRSRFNNIDFTFTEADQKALKYKYAERLLMVSKKEGLKLSGDGLEALIPKFFPDLRSMLNLLQSFKAEGKLEVTANDIKNSYSLYDNLFGLVFNSKPEDIYKLIMDQYSSRVETVMSAFFNDFPKYIQKEKPEYLKYIPHFLIKIANYQHMKNTIIDPPLAPIAMIYELQLIVNQEKVNMNNNINLIMGNKDINSKVKSKKYITFMKLEHEDWEILRPISSNLEKHLKSNKQLSGVNLVEDVKTYIIGEEIQC